VTPERSRFLIDRPEYASRTLVLLGDLGTVPNRADLGSVLTASAQRQARFLVISADENQASPRCCRSDLSSNCRIVIVVV
jgi:hypothetical protein